MSNTVVDDIFQTFREEGQYADYPLEVNGEHKFKLHKAIISKQSKYFNSMFNNSKFEVNNQLTVENQYITLEQCHFDVVFDYLYGKQLKQVFRFPD